MMTKKKSKLIASITLIILLSAVCATSAFDLKKDDDKVVYSFCLQNAKNSDEASVLFWNWLLRHIRLSPKNAALHNIYQQDTVAFFYDLDNDGRREIIGTHYASAIAAAGDFLLYILKYDNESKQKYKLISDYLYFDAFLPIEIIEDKTAGYHKIRVVSQNDYSKKIYAFDKRKGIYTEK